MLGWVRVEVEGEGVLRSENGAYNDTCHLCCSLMCFIIM